MSAGFVVVVGAEHKAAERLCRLWLSEGWTVLASFTGEGGGEDRSRYEDFGGDSRKLHTIAIDPRDSESVQSLSELAASVMERIDMVVVAIDRRRETRLRDGMSCEDVLAMYEYNALAPLRTIEALLPLMEDGMKRLCFLSDVRGSFAAGHGSDYAGYGMSLAAKHMSVKIMSNSLGPRGYTFRILTLNGEREGFGLTEEAALRASRWLADFTDESLLKLENELAEPVPF
ncbi:SDR family oxidoreductase [Paenibacillus soyae]|uniref:SDR family oxidoreductase n=1 Tax=Paenibacillus soyae TaxID=2969249 RepID=A0A9X2MQY5_9BACL|nr:SDR family oxidoreductase [Paenibacillus soyae]MCR2804647.1 SDR family oxidoreductase [Paenibacillus soyae]